jgi:hypothetical protein
MELLEAFEGDFWVPAILLMWGASQIASYLYSALLLGALVKK